MSTSDQTERPRVRQCATCPWKIGAVPDRDIPNGYCVDLHKSLDRTIQTGLDSLFRPSGVAMACHYAKIGEEFVCAGWLHNQLGVGNNISVRLKVMSGKLPIPEVDGEQHESFEDTLPKKRPRSRTTKKKPPTKRRKTP